MHIATILTSTYITGKTFIAVKFRNILFVLLGDMEISYSFSQCLKHFPKKCTLLVNVNRQFYSFSEEGNEGRLA
jgi:hypothetical protein